MDQLKKLPKTTRHPTTWSVDYPQLLSLRQGEYDLVDLTTMHGKQVLIARDEYLRMVHNPRLPMTLCNDVPVAILPIPLRRR